LIAMSPAVPSEPLPERTTPMALLPSSVASDTRNSSIGIRTSFSVRRGVTFSRRPATRMALLGGIT